LTRPTDYARGRHGPVRFVSSSPSTDWFDVRGIDPLWGPGDERSPPCGAQACHVPEFSLAGVRALA